MTWKRISFIAFYNSTKYHLDIHNFTTIMINIWHEVVVKVAGTEWDTMEPRWRQKPDGNIIE